MIGGTGNDTYIVNYGDDLIVEYAGEGTDTVLSSVSYKLPANVENLTLTGNQGIYGFGNSLNNTITGNDNSNWLKGDDGDDRLFGGGGDDELFGGKVLLFRRKLKNQNTWRRFEQKENLRRAA